MDQLNFTKDWTVPSDFPPVVSNETQARENIQLLHDETKDYINRTIVPAIENLSSGGGDVNTQVSALRKRVDKNEKDITANRNSIGTLTPKVNTATSDISALGGRVSTTESNVSALDGRVATAESDVSTNKTHIRTIENEIGNIKTQLDILNCKVVTGTYTGDGAIEKSMKFDREVFLFFSSPENGALTNEANGTMTLVHMSRYATFANMNGQDLANSWRAQVSVTWEESGTKITWRERGSRVTVNNVSGHIYHYVAIVKKN